MKFWILAFGFAVSLAQTVAADVRNDLVGTWSGTTTTTYKGKITKSTFVQKYAAFQSRGLVLKSSVKFPGQSVSKGVLRFYDSGKISGALFQDGDTIATISGKWTVEGDSLISRTEVFALNGSFSQTSTTTLLSKSKFSTTAKTSNGVRGIGAGKKS